MADKAIIEPLFSVSLDEFKSETFSQLFGLYEEAGILVGLPLKEGERTISLRYKNSNYAEKLAFAEEQLELLDGEDAEFALKVVNGIRGLRPYGLSVNEEGFSLSTKSYYFEEYKKLFDYLVDCEILISAKSDSKQLFNYRYIEQFTLPNEQCMVLKGKDIFTVMSEISNGQTFIPPEPEENLAVLLNLRQQSQPKLVPCRQSLH